MLSPQKSAELVERLFDKLTLIFGVQKVGSMWEGIEDRSSVLRLWEQQLSRFHPQSIGAALQSVIDSGKEWPPTLPEFVEACRQSALGRQQQAPALLAPGKGETSAEEARRKVADMVAMLAKKCETPTR